jgi:tetratricopeptide (TPR) repeat protein
VRKLLIVIALAACARDPQLMRWDADFYYTEKLYIDGQHDLAVARYKALQKSAKDPRDADEAALMACEVDARSLKFAQAATCYEALASDGLDRGVRIRALVQAAELRYYELNQQAEGLKMWVTVCRLAPDEAASQRALDHLYKHGQSDTVAREEMERLFEKLYDADPKGELADNYLLRGAMLREEEGTADGQARALVLLDKLETEFPDAQTLPDAWMLHTKILKKLGRFAEEAVILERVIETFETSHIFASYALTAHTDAALRLIELYRGPLNNLARAELQARHLPEMLHHPVKIYHYLWVVAEIQEARGHLADAIATLQELLQTNQEAQADMAENDTRICDESETAEMKERCFADLAAHPAQDPKEVAMAKAKIAELQEKLKVTARSTP